MMPKVPDSQAIQNLLGFWFADDTKAHWYQSTIDFDDLCRAQFGGLVGQAARGGLESWEATAEGALALCLLLDQMPRNIFRGSPKAFENDPKAVRLAMRSIDKGFDRQLDLERRKFLYLPFMHSETLADQETAVALFTPLNDENSLAYAEEHADVIRRFGRFPHRNQILGRESTAEERAFLADGAKDYGQSSAKG